MPLPAHQSQIEAAEKELGRRLPANVRARLLAANGSEIELRGESWQLHPVWDPTTRHSMRKTTDHIVRETHSAREWRGFPVDAISIAANETGDRLILIGHQDIVWFWDHETGRTEPVSLTWS